VVWARDLTAHRHWRSRSDVVQTGELEVTRLRNGHRYRFRVRPVKGWARATDTSSNLVTLRPHRA